MKDFVIGIGAGITVGLFILDIVRRKKRGVQR